MAEGKALGKDDLFEKDAFQNATNGAKELLAVIKETQDTIKGSLTAQKEFVSTFKAKSYDDVKKLNEAIAETNTLIKQKEQLTKAEIQIQQQSEKLNQEKLKTQREEIKNSAIIEKQNKATERSLNALNGEYAKGVKQLAEIKKQLKELEFTGRNNGKLYKQLGKEFEELDKKVRKAETSVGEFQRNVGNYPNAVKELKALNREMQNMEVGTAEFEKAAKKAGQLRDQIKDAKEATAVFANESKTAQASTAFGQMLGSIKDLDFKDAADKAKVFAGVVSSITFKEVIDGMKNFGVALLSVGKALLANPFTLLAAAVAGVAYAIYSIVEANKKLDESWTASQKGIDDHIKRIEELTKKQAEYIIKLREARGEITKGEADALRLQGNILDERKELAKRNAEELIQLQKDYDIDVSKLNYFHYGSELKRYDAYKKRLKEVEKAQAAERTALLKAQIAEQQALRQETANDEKEEREKKKKANEAEQKRIEKEEEEKLKARRDAMKKQFDETWNQFTKDSKALNDYIAEQEVKRIEDDEKRRKAEAQKKHDDDVKRIQDSIATNELKNDAILAADRTLQAELAQIEKEAQDKKDAEEAKRQDKKAKAAEAEFKKKYEQYQKDIENQKKVTQQAISEMDKLEKYVEAAYAKKNKIANDYLDSETKANETAIEQQQRLAERGLDNTLAFEKEKAAKLELERKRQQEREVRQQKIFAFYSLFSSYAKTDPNTALQKAIVDTAIAEVVSGSFIDGTESVERDLKGNKVHNGKDGYVIAVDGDERIFNPSQNAKIGNISNDEAAQILHDYQKGLLFNYGNIEQPKAVLLNQNIALEETNTLLRELLSVERNKPVHQTNIDNLGNVINTEIRNGVHKVTTIKRRI